MTDWTESDSFLTTLTATNQPNHPCAQVCSNWGNWVAMAGLTGGRVNHFNIAKQVLGLAVKGSLIVSDSQLTDRPPSNL